MNCAGLGRLLRLNGVSSAYTWERKVASQPHLAAGHAAHSERSGLLCCKLKSWWVLVAAPLRSWGFDLLICPLACRNASRSPMPDRWPCLQHRAVLLGTTVKRVNIELAKRPSGMRLAGHQSALMHKETNVAITWLYLHDWSSIRLLLVAACQQRLKGSHNHTHQVSNRE